MIENYRRGLAGLPCACGMIGRVLGGVLLLISVFFSFFFLDRSTVLVVFILPGCFVMFCFLLYPKTFSRRGTHDGILGGGGSRLGAGTHQFSMCILLYDR